MENQIMDETDLEQSEPWGFAEQGASPDDLNAMAQQAMDSASSTPMPKPPEPAGDLTVELPGGIMHPSLGRLRHIEVRELDGFAEEALARVTDAGEYKTKLLQLGVASVDGRPVDDPGLLSSMLIGDRDEVIVAIRKATFGKELELDLTCRNCGEEQKVIYDFDADLKSRPLKDDEFSFDFKMASGKTALIRLPTAQDENDVLSLTKRKNATVADANTLMLQRLVEEIDGFPITVANEVKGIGMKDRRDILNEIYERRVGPDFEAVEYACINCEEESPLVIGVFDMFR